MTADLTLEGHECYSGQCMYAGYVVFHEKLQSLRVSWILGVFDPLAPRLVLPLSPVPNINAVS